MATYEELRAMFGNDALRNRIEVAVILKAHAILQEVTPSAARLAWVVTAFTATETQAVLLLKYALAANAAATVAQITGAADAVLLTAIGAAVDKLYP
jgi:hypothetical protein